MKSLAELKKNYRPAAVAKRPESDFQWFRDAKFGMFLHWGLYSLVGRGEWVMFNERISTSEYAKLADQFTVAEFNPRAWAKTAKAAGMKYMVLTTRHHDGFSLFASKASEFNAVNSAARRDLVAEYVEACRAEGLKVGLYYSPMDWRFPGYFFPDMYLDSALAMREQCRQQLRELMTNYGKIDLLWFDGEWLAHGGIKFGEPGWYRDADFGKDELFFKVNYFWQSEEVINMIRELQPDILINNRFGWEGDFHVRERRIGDMRTDKAWDSNDCLTESWGWIPGAPMLSLREAVRNLVNIVVRDGNYLLNVGPTGTGAMEDRQVKRLAQMGEWLAQYGESVYGTRGGPFLPGAWGGSTYQGDTAWLHIIEWKEDVVSIPLEGRTILRVESPTCPRFSAEEKNGHLLVSVPPEHRHPLDSIVKLTFDKPIVWSGVAAAEDDIYGLADGLEHE